MSPWSIRHRWLMSVALVAPLLVAAGCSGGSSGTAGPASAGASAGVAGSGATKTVTLTAAGNSGVSGTATLTDVGGDQTQVVVAVEADHNRDMPGAITPGTCGAIDESTIYYLNDTREGASTTLVPISLDDLTAKPFILHIHTAPDDASLAACGEIR
jgi:hypothetical protein